MGFHINFENNAHFNQEPNTRKECKKNFDALCADWKVTMEPQDMFWGAYLGGPMDKYEFQWTFNYTEK